jgi:hypothetical protein
MTTGYTVVLTRQWWKAALEFAMTVNATVLTSFTVSEGVRDDSHAWTPKMAAPWMAYTRSIGGRIYAAELFNEPNAPEPPRVPKGIPAGEFARDFATFREFMAKAAPDVKLTGPTSATLGIPGVSAIMKPTPEDYASANPAPKFDIFSYHFYPTHRIDDPYAMLEEGRAIVLHLFRQQAVVRPRRPNGMHEELVGSRIACLAERLVGEHTGGSHLQQQLAGTFREMRCELTVAHGIGGARVHGINLATIASAA